MSTENPKKKKTGEKILIALLSIGIVVAVSYFTYMAVIISKAKKALPAPTGVTEEQIEAKMKQLKANPTVYAAIKAAATQNKVTKYYQLRSRAIGDIVAVTQPTNTGSPANRTPVQYGG